MDKHTPAQPLKFPKRFLWGAASSAHQIEGGNHNQWSVWELENAKVLAKLAHYQASFLPVWEDIKQRATDPANYISGQAANHYSLYKEDLALLKKMNMNAWRFSIEWSRIEPEEGSWNAEAIQHYREYFKYLQHAGIEPMVTLWHWTLPVWFAQKGGFAKRGNVKYFVRFAAKVFEEFGRYFRYVITLNEPEIYTARSYLNGEWPPQVQSKRQAFRVLNNLLYAHKQVYALAKSVGRKHRVSIAKNLAHHYAGDDAKLTVMTTDMMRYVHDYYVLNRLKKHLDFVGVNYYFSNRYYGYRQHNVNDALSDSGWDMQPANIEHVLKDVADRYNVPIIITENGVADQNDAHRKWWITQTLLGMSRAMQAGVKLEGYFHWSLTDNFEWSSGFWPRFGLFHVDYAMFKRTPRKSAVWLAAVIKKIRA